jgi:hypothetical protein
VANCILPICYKYLITCINVIFLVPYVDTSEVRLNDKPNKLPAKRSAHDIQSESHDQLQGNEAAGNATASEQIQRRSTRKKKGLNTG